VPTSISIGQRDTSCGDGSMIATVRRQGDNPSGANPASAATSSPHAPAAFTTTGARNIASRAVVMLQRPSWRSIRAAR
jgi:hypothetical protein